MQRLLANGALVGIIGFASTVITRHGLRMHWYRPPPRVTPPPWVFGLMWPIIYTQAVCVLQRRNSSPWLVVAALLLGLLWCIVFFGKQGAKQGAVVLACNWLVLLMAVLQTQVSVDRLLLLPWLCWLTYAFSLNIACISHGA